MRRIISLILFLTIILTSLSFGVSADTSAITGTYKMVKDPINDTNGMLFNSRGGGKASGLAYLGHERYDENGQLNYPVFMDEVNVADFGKAMQFDIRQSTTLGLSYRFPLNIKSGDTFGNEPLTNLTDKFFYVSYYMRSVPGENDEKKNPYIKFDGGIRNESKSDKLATFNGISGTSYSYSENWQKFQGTHLATADTFGARNLVSSYDTFSGAPFLRFLFKGSLENYSVQIADLKAIMFDSEESYNNIKDISMLKTLSFDGKSLDITQTDFTAKPENIETPEQLKDMISYTPSYEFNKVVVDIPKTLPGYVKITSYALNSDFTNPTETNKTVYNIYVDYKLDSNSIKIDTNFFSGKADISATIVNNEDMQIYAAFYDAENKLVDVKSFVSEAKTGTRKFDQTINVPANAVKAKAFLWNSAHVPIANFTEIAKKIIKSEFLVNGNFEIGTHTGWTRKTKSNEVVSEGYKSNYSMKIYDDEYINQDITTDVAEAGPGFYYLTAYVKSATNEDANVVANVYYKLTDDTANKTTTSRRLAVGSEWLQLNEVVELVEYKTVDGKDVLDIESNKEIIYAKPFIGGYSNADTDYILVDNISFTKIAETDGTVVNTINKPSVFVISDSLGQDYLTGSYPRQGWGNTLRGIFGDNVNYFNLALSGWSTRTYVEGVPGDTSFTRPIWHKYKTAIKEGDYVIISLGHNDLSGAKKTSVEEYKAFLKTMVDDTRNAGGNVIFVSNVPNANPLLDYSYKRNVNKRYQEVFVPYAAELGVPCINMNLAMTQMEAELLKDPDYLEKYQNGRSAHQQAIYLFNLADNGFIESDSDFNYNQDESTDSYFDATHIQYRGAQYVAEFLENQFKTKNLGIEKYLKNNQTELISNGGFETGLFDWNVPETRCFTFELPQGAPQQYGNNYGKLTTTGTISQDITQPLNMYGNKKYTLTADVTTKVNVVVKANGVAVCTVEISPASKTAEIDLSAIKNVTSATIEFTATEECTFDNISIK